MTKARLINLKRFGVAMASLLATASLLTSCGGGGGEEGDTSPPTVRPKTLDDLILSFDGNVNFELVRTTGTVGALRTGDVETGTFFYTRNGNELRQYPNRGNDQSDTHWPDEIANASYTYEAINETSGILTLNGTGVNDLTTSGGMMNALNGSYTFLFNYASDEGAADLLDPLVPIHQVVVDLTFSGNGETIISNVATVAIPGSTLPQYDIIYVPTAVTLAGGGPVPENYYPILDAARPSKIAAASLDGLIFNYTNGIPDTTLDFTIQFVTQATFPNKKNETDPDETGQGLMKVDGVALSGAVNYTWRRINGTDTGILVISGIGGGDPTTFNGSYTISFDGVDNGTYTGEVDGDTLNAAEVSGSFSIPTGV